jgi:hypothetical protein
MLGWLIRLLGIALVTLSPGAGEAQAQSRVPLVFVPGIGGSVLADRATKKVYFGGIKQTMDQFARLELPIDRSKDKLV